MNLEEKDIMKLIAKAELNKNAAAVTLRENRGQLSGLSALRFKEFLSKSSEAQKSAEEKVYKKTALDKTTTVIDSALSNVSYAKILNKRIALAKEMLRTRKNALKKLVANTDKLDDLCAKISSTANLDEAIGNIMGMESEALYLPREADYDSTKVAMLQDILEDLNIDVEHGGDILNSISTGGSWRGDLCDFLPTPPDPIEREGPFVANGI